MLEFDGTNANVLVVRQSETYGAVLEGKISARLNSRLLDRATEKADYIWPGLEVVLLPPEEVNGKLPQIQCMSLLENVSSTGARSRIVLIHYENILSDHFSVRTREILSTKRWPSGATSGSV